MLRDVCNRAHIFHQLTRLCENRVGVTVEEPDLPIGADYAVLGVEVARRANCFLQRPFDIHPLIGVDHTEKNMIRGFVVFRVQSEDTEMLT